MAENKNPGGRRRDGSSRVYQTDKILKYIESRPGQNSYIDDIVAEVDGVRGSVQGTIARLMKVNPEIQEITHGRVWRWQPNHKAQAPANSAKMYEELVTTPDGMILIRDEDGKVYQAVPINTITR